MKKGRIYLPLFEFRMPVLAANQVTLAEVLEVKGAPLNEEEIWAVLCQAGKELELLLARGTYLFSSLSLVLCTLLNKFQSKSQMWVLRKKCYMQFFVLCEVC